MFSSLAWISSSHGVLILQRMAKKLAFENSRHSGREQRRTAVFAGYVRTLLNLACVYTSTVSNRHGYILSKPYKKKYTISKPSHEYDLFVFLAVTSWPRHVLWPEIWRRLYLLRFATFETKCDSSFALTSDEVKLLLRITNEYKVAKSAENVDWEPVY